MQSSTSSEGRMDTEPAAKYCGSTKSTFDKLRVSGAGPIFIKIGRRVVYDKRDLDDWLTSNRRRSTSDNGHDFNDLSRGRIPRSAGGAAKARENANRVLVVAKTKSVTEPKPTRTAHQGSHDQ